MKKYGFTPGSPTSAIERMSHEAEQWLAEVNGIRRFVEPLPEEAMRELRHAKALIDRIRNAVFDEDSLNA